MSARHKRRSMVSDEWANLSGDPRTSRLSLIKDPTEWEHENMPDRKVSDESPCSVLASYKTRRTKYHISGLRINLCVGQVSLR